MGKTEEPSKEEPSKEEEASKEEAPEPLTAEALKLPEGLETSDEHMAKFVETMNNAELSPQEKAQALVDLQSDVMKAASERNSALWRETQEQWVKEAREDPDIGGQKLEPALGAVNKLVDEFSQADELREVFDLTGAGNHPVMIKFLHSLASKLSEGQPVAGKPTEQSRSAADVIYGGS